MNKDFLEYAKAYKELLKDAQETLVAALETSSNSVVVAKANLYKHPSISFGTFVVVKFTINGEERTAEAEFKDINWRTDLSDYRLQEHLRELLSVSLAKQIAQMIDFELPKKEEHKQAKPA